MAFDKVIDSAKLDAGMTATANAIRAKTGGSSPIEWDEETGFKTAVEVISSGDGVELPELGDTAAQPTDMVAGKVLYDDDGNPVTGTLIEVNEIQEKLFATSDYSFGGTPGGTAFNVSGMYNGNRDGVVVRPGAGLGVRNAPTDFFGNATPNQVAKGATFTSAAGLLVEGTHECEGGITLPELTNPATATDLALDKQLIDENGIVVTGTLAESEVGTKVMAGDDIVLAGKSGDTVFSIGGMYGKKYIDDDSFHGFICRAGTNFYIRNVPTSLFGDATADQVSKGATFTSAAGLLVEGTHECETGVQMRVEGDTLYITGDVAVENETLIL